MTATIANTPGSKSPGGIANRKARASLFALSIAAPIFFVTASPARAEVECSPYCDYTHDYGPYDLTWIRPGLYAFPVCGPSGDCAPHAVHTYPRYRSVRITVRRHRRQ
jgi:hypothetical protein